MPDDAKRSVGRIFQRLAQHVGKLPRLTRLWWGAGLVLIAAVPLVSAVADGSCLYVLLVMLLVLWAIPSSFLVLLWVWRKLTYRISVRLLISYFLIGVVPFPLILVLVALASYLLIGQYASAEYGDVASELREDVERVARRVLEVAEVDGRDEAVAVLEAGYGLGVESAKIWPQVEWLLVADGASRSDGFQASVGAELEVPEWAEEGVDSGPFLTAGGPATAAVARRGEQLAVILLPLDSATAGALSEGMWYELSFTVREVQVDEGNISISDPDEDLPEPAEDDDASSDGTAGGVATGPNAADQATTEPRPEGTLDKIWGSRWIYFFRLSRELRRWEDGSAAADLKVAAVIKTSPREAAADFFRSPYELGRKVWAAVAALAIFLLMVYLGVVLLAALQIFAITRSTARLTKGTRQVEAGDLDVRIPVKRRDQLGDLAVSFNRMTSSVKGMLAEVEEKERLKNELELAREIQQSLLPARYLRHDSLSVRAYFRPAAEVGGDYFDIFPLDRERLIVAAGDVAGHGLSTGLLMAMVKSAVATLVQEGHRGVELLQRLNRFMLEQPREHRMVTLAIADVDLAAGVAEITNAAHPPVFISHGTVREVILPALPVGFAWRRPPPSERLDIEPGSRLVFYSDGLVEAIDDDEEQFGYERLKDLLAAHAEESSEQLMATLLAALEAHTGGRDLDDDLTILIIDCGSPADPGSRLPG